jgi:uncharacterized protein (DUF885 family)
LKQKDRDKARDDSGSRAGGEAGADGGRPGPCWFNTERPTAGTGWDLEAAAFHEAVPGHHLQLSGLQLFTDLPASTDW